MAPGLITRAARRLARGALEPGTTPLVPDIDPAYAERAVGPRITIASWNIAWAYGWGSELGASYQPRPRAAFEARLAEIAAVLRAIDADVVLLQEVDFDAARSAHLDQADVLRRLAGYRTVLRAPSWQVRYLPYPYWPRARHAGALVSGGAVLTRLPVRAATRTLWPKPPDMPAARRRFYLYRYAVRLELAAPAPVIVTTHLDAFSVEARRAEVGGLLELIAHDDAVVVAGDLNVPPPEAERRAHYPDEPWTDHRADDTHQRLRAAGLRPALQGEALVTFPAHAPNRMLDHAYLRGALRVEHARVVPTPTAPSDHLPITVTVSLSSSSPPSGDRRRPC